MIRKGSPSYSYFEILDACKQPDCPVCSLGHAAARRNINTLIYEGVNDYGLRAKLRESLGYCHEHAWLLPEAGESAALGIAIVHRDLLNTIREQLNNTDFDKSQSRKIRSLVADAISPENNKARSTKSARFLPAKEPCPACKNRDKMEELALKSIDDALKKSDQEMEAALRESDGLCLPHLRQALESTGSQQAFETLVILSKEQISALIGELDEFIRKSDHRFREEKITERERESWRRALKRVVGPKS
ncbi:MAG: DUF6062 family protein [Candidatus Promineifilaceae bacterium]|nr:DUF6062 family protein [Candidatus Promineifilaceae bacterium]